MKKLFLLMVLVGLMLVACGGGDADDPAATVERYLQAKADADAATINELLCSDMEAVAEREARTFEGVQGVQLEGMACSSFGDSGIVTCEGKFTAEYGTETTEFPLTAYLVVEEDGEWKWCGEAVQ
jgi:hypothetical protein